jgi:carboxymethylenebutenolidase
MDGLEEAMDASSRLDWETTVADTVAVTRALRERPEVRGGTGIMGFCFGGGLAWATAAALTDAGDPPAVLVAYYGSQIPSLLDLADRVRVPQLHHWGTADQFIPAQGVAAVEAATAGPETTFVRHEGAGHAFDNPSPAFHHPQASQDAWASTTAWLAEHLV